MGLSSNFHAACHQAVTLIRYIGLMRVFHQTNSARTAANYFTKQSEYYGSEVERKPGLYFGKGAVMLGLTPDTEVTEEAFSQLCHNIDPNTGERLTQRNRDGRRVLTDLTFSAPKSLSVMWGITEDDRLLDAVQQATIDTLSELEEDAATRVHHKDGSMTLEKTGNITGVAWLHSTARPIDGHPDPQIHVHAAVINATQADDRWKALDLSSVVRDSGYWNAQFMARLASNVQELGYDVERSEHNFEIAGVSRNVIDKFSRRAKVIDEKADELGITSKAAKDKLAASTRGGKSESLVRGEDLFETWRSRLEDDEANQLSRAIAKDHDVTPPLTTAKASVDYAINHQFQNSSVVRMRHLERDALLHGLGGSSLDDIRSEIQSRNLITRGCGEEQEVTTRAVLKEESQVVDFARNGKGQVRPLAADHAISREWLSDEQKNAVSGLLESSDRVMIVRGVAGSGKTTIMNEFSEQIEQQGKHMTVLAPNAETVHDVLRKQEGFDANTLAHFLLNENAQAAAAGGVIWVDEAGLVGMQQMNQLFHVAGSIDARVVLGGDVAQHKPVARGMPLKLIENESGIQPFEIKTIRRQQDETYRKAVTELSNGDIAEGFKTLRGMDVVHEIEDNQERATAIANAYADAVDNHESTLVVAPANAERAVITDAIRDDLKRRGHVSSDEHTITALKSRRLSDAQKTDATRYRAGTDVVQFHRRSKGGWKSGSRVTVDAVEDGKVFTDTPHGRVEIPVHDSGAFDVFEPHAMSIAAGDVLRITKNRRPVNGENSKLLNNGSRVTLESISEDGRLVFTNGQSVAASWGFVDHGVSVTSHSSQGKTFDNVLIAQSSSSFGASSREQAYVSASRGRQKIAWYTSNLPDLQAAITQQRPDKMAHEMINTAPRRTKQLASYEPRKRWHQRAQEFATSQLKRFRQWSERQQQREMRRA